MSANVEYLIYIIKGNKRMALAFVDEMRWLDKWWRNHSSAPPNKKVEPFNIHNFVSNLAIWIIVEQHIKKQPQYIVSIIQLINNYNTCVCMYISPFHHSRKLVHSYIHTMGLSFSLWLLYTAPWDSWFS